MLVNNLMRNLNANMGRMDKLQNQLASGRKFAHISDDPIALIYSQAARNKIARLSHYQGAVGTAGDWLNQAESGIMELQKAIGNAYESAVDAATDVKTDDDRRNIAATMAQLRDHFVDTLNTTFGDKFVFGGYNTPGDPAMGFIADGVKPFVVKDLNDGNGPQLFYNGFSLSQFDGMDAQDYYDMIGPPPDYTLYSGSAADLDTYIALKNDILSFDVGPGIEMPVTMNGIELILNVSTDEDGNKIMRNAFNVLQDLFEAAEYGTSPENTAAAISKIIKPLQDSQNHLLTKTAEIGGRVRRLELLEARYEQDAINYERMKSDAEDVEFDEVIMYQKMAEAVYQAALSVGARIIQPTLMDFLR